MLLPNCGRYTYIAHNVTKDCQSQSDQAEMILFHEHGGYFYGQVASSSGRTFTIRTDGMIDGRPLRMSRAPGQGQFVLKTPRHDERLARHIISDSRQSDLVATHAIRAGIQVEFCRDGLVADVDQQHDAVLLVGQPPSTAQYGFRLDPRLALPMPGEIAVKRLDERLGIAF